MTDRPILFSAPMVRSIIREIEAPGTGKTMTRRVISRRNCTVLGSRWGRNSPWEGLRLDEAIVRNASPISGLPDPHLAVPFCHPDDEPTPSEECGIYRVRPIWEVGDSLWVRETFVIESNREYDGAESFPSDGRPIMTKEDGDGGSYDLVPHYRATEPEPHIVPYRILEKGDDDDRTRWRPAIFMPRWTSRLTLIVNSVKVERLQDISLHDAQAEGIDVGPLSARGAKNAFRNLWQSINGPGSWDANPWVAAISFAPHLCNIDRLDLADRPICDEVA